MVDSFGRVIDRQIGIAGRDLQSTGAVIYDPHRLFTTFESPLGVSTTVRNSSDGRVQTVTDSSGRLVTTLRDGAGRTLSTSLSQTDDSAIGDDDAGSGNAGVQFQARQTSYAYDAAGRLEGYTDPLGNTSSIVYDALGDTVTRLSPALVDGDDSSRLSTTDHFDDFGRLIRRIDASGNATEYTYDPAGRLETTTLPSPGGVDADGQPLPSPSVTNAYNGFGEIVSQTDHRGRVTTMTYDALGRMSTRTSPDPDGDGPLPRSTTHYQYDDAGNMVATFDAINPATTKVEYQYDSFGRVTKQILPPPTSDHTGPRPEISYQYDDDGRLSQTTDIHGGVTDIVYDDLGRETSRTLPAGIDGGVRGTVSRTYDDAGNLHTVTDPLGQTTTMQYDIAGQLTQITSPNPDGGWRLKAPVQQYRYDAAGRVIQVAFTYVDAAQPYRTVDYAYDALGRLTTQTTSDPDRDGPLGEFIQTWQYDAAGNVTVASDSAGFSTTMTHDDLGRELTRTTVDPDGDGPLTASTLHRTYDAAGNIDSVTDDSGETTRFRYDRAGREIVRVDPAVDGQSPLWRTSYDAFGRVDRTTDPLGRSTDYQYDHWGRLTTTIYPTLDPRAYDDIADNTQLSPGQTFDRLQTSQTYNNAGQIASSTDTAGRTTTFHYDRLGRHIETVYPTLDARPAVNGRDHNSEITSVARTRTEYDVAGQITATYDTLDRQTRYEYDHLGRITVVVEPAADGRRDRDGTSANGPVYRTFYDNHGNIKQTVDPLWRMTEYRYDDWGRQIEVRSPDPDGGGPLPRPHHYSRYDDAGNLVVTSDHLGRETTTTYDAIGRVVATTLTDPDGNGPKSAPTFTTVYNQAGGVAAETDAAGRTTSYFYDALGRLNRTVLPDPDPTDNVAAPVSVQTHDLVGNVITAIDPHGTTATWTYDAWNRTIGEIYNDPDGSGPDVAPQTRWTYDDAGNVATESILAAFETPAASGASAGSNDDDWLTTTYVHDRWNRNVAVIAPGGDQTTYDYDIAGNQVALIDASGNQTAYHYDSLDRVTRVTNAAGDHRTMTYDINSRLTSRTDRNGRTIEFDYDNADRIIRERWLGDDNTTAHTITTTYDGAGNVQVVMDGSLVDTYTYDRLDQKVGHRRFGGAAPDASFFYDIHPDGSWASVNRTVDGNAPVVTSYTYDGAGAVREIMQTGDAIADLRVTYDRNSIGQVVALDRSVIGRPGVSVATTVDRDEIGRRTTIAHQNAADAVLAAYDYRYDAASRTRSIDSLIDGLTDLNLDDNGRLIGADHASIDDESYAYDATGNRVGGGHVVDINNRLLSDGTFEYVYDDEGNRTQRRQIGGTRRTLYDYDHRNRLIRVRHYDGDRLTDSVGYQYDHANIRVARHVDADGDGSVDHSQHYVVDGDTVTATTDAAGRVLHQYLHGATVDEVLADQSSAGGLIWTLGDAQHTIRDLVADPAAGSTQLTVSNHRTYDSFGNLIASTDDTVEHLFGYTGREYDAATQLHYHRDRWMDPAVGLFLSEDPIGFAGGDVNLSNYVGSAPADYTDPTSNGWFSDLWKKAKRTFKRAVDDIGDDLEDAWDWARENPVVTTVAVVAASFLLPGVGTALAAGFKAAAAGTGTAFASAATTVKGVAVGVGKGVTGAVGKVASSASLSGGSSGVTATANLGSTWTVGATLGAGGSLAPLNYAMAGATISALGFASDHFRNRSGSRRSSQSDGLSGTTNFTVSSGPREFSSAGTAVGGGHPPVHDDGFAFTGYSDFTSSSSFPAGSGSPWSDLRSLQQPSIFDHQSMDAAGFQTTFRDPSMLHIDWKQTYYEPLELSSPRQQVAVRTDDSLGPTVQSDIHPPQRPWYSRLGDSISVGVAGVGGSVSGAFQGAFNIANSFTDLAADLGNTATLIPNALANAIYDRSDTAAHDRVLIPSIPKSDWAKNLLVQQSDLTFQTSKLVGGSASQIVTGLGIAKAAQGVGAIGRIAKGFEVVDTLEGINSTVTGAFDAIQNGVTLSNAAQTILGGSSLVGTFAEPLEDIAKHFEIKFDPATLSSGPIPLGGVKIQRKAAPGSGQYPIGASSRVDIQGNRVYSLQPSNNGTGPPRWTRMNDGPNFTDADRVREWKRLADDPRSGLSAAERAQIKARGNRGPQRLNEHGELETMELSHEPIPLRDGGTTVVPRSPADHAAIDSHRHLKKRD